MVYWIIFLLLLGGSFVVRNSPWHTGPSVHTLMESVATVLGFMVGALSLVRFYSRKQATFLFIGTGFLGAGLLDLNHALITSNYFILEHGMEAEDLFAWSWTSERVFLSIFLFVSLLGWRQEVRAADGDGDVIHEGSVYATALILTLLNLFFFEWVPLKAAHFPDLAVSRPAEFVPAVFFTLAFFGYLAKGDWKTDAFEHWLLVSLLISAMAHAGYMAMSQERFDAMFDAAHLLKIASYVAILTGLLFSVYETFRREGQALGAITAAKVTLEREVSVRARTEQAVKESRARLQDFLDNANDLIQSVAPDGKILYVNSAWKRTLGYTDDELERLNLFDLVKAAHRDLVQQEFTRVLEGASARRFNVEYTAADGRTVVLSGSAAAQQVRGEAVATQGIFRDVTEQRLAERQLAESKANTTALVENTGDSIWSVDREHRLITFNSAFALAMEARTGREPDVGQLPSDAFGPDAADWYEDLYNRALRGERHVAVRTEEVDGQLRFFEIYANPIQGDEGIHGAVLFGKDVTPRVRAEEALRMAKEEAEAANKAKSDFLASMSHELRTPLNSIIGFTNILLKNRDERLQEKDLNFLQRVLANGKHLLELINEVLDLAKVEAGRMELIIDDVDLAPPRYRDGRPTRGAGQGQGGQRRPPGRCTRGRGNGGDRLGQAQAGHHQPRRQRAEVHARRFRHRAPRPGAGRPYAGGRSRCRTPGSASPGDRLEAIFEAFQQAEAGTSRKYGGTGLGLALSRSICLLMGYDLIVESEVGKGSTFSIVMGERARKPIMPQADEEPEKRPEEAVAEAEEGQGEGEEHPSDQVVSLPRMRDFKVLVIDDERDSRDLMAHYLEEFGCQVIQEKNGEDGIDAARAHDPDLITLDLMMPGMTGWEVLKQLKADPELRRIPVVVVSIVAGEGRGRLLGAVDLITKPFEREDLLRVLWRNLVRKRGGRVLVVNDEDEMREMLSRYLAGLGLEVATAVNGEEALEAVRTEAPDAVLLDLVMPVMDGMGFLRKLRANPVHQGLPVLVLSAKDLTKEEQKDLGDMASGILTTADVREGRLRQVLDSMFTLAEPGDDG